VKVGTHSFRGRGTSALPWTERDFIGRLERVKAGAEVGVPGVSAGLSHWFLNCFMARRRCHR
jgi:hypothetical protein